MTRDTDNANERKEEKTKARRIQQEEKKQGKEHAPKKGPAAEYHPVHLTTDILTLINLQHSLVVPSLVEGSAPTWTRCRSNCALLQ